MSNDELVIAFLVVGQNDEPLNGSILAAALEDGGNQLASALSIAVSCANSISTHASKLVWHAELTKCRTGHMHSYYKLNKPWP